MSKDQIAAVLDRVRTWPEERQQDAVRLLLEMEAQDSSPHHLSDDQLTEVRRRRMKAEPRYVSLTEVRQRFRRPNE
jgi:hypothetical protein